MQWIVSFSRNVKLQDRFIIIRSLFMFASFNKAFREKLEIPKDIQDKSKICSKCEHLVYDVENHHMGYICTKDTCDKIQKLKT